MQLTPEEESALRWWISWTTEDMQQRIWFWENKANTSHPHEKKSSDSCKRMFDTVKALHDKMTAIKEKRVFL
jgi:hypothetical protein